MSLPRRALASAALRRAVGLAGILCALAPPQVAGADPLGDALSAVLNSAALAGGSTGVIVERVSDGQVLYARDADTRLVPASNRKLFTSAVALELLGGSYTFTTSLLAGALPGAGGTLRGDVALRGVGDSLLSADDLDAMAAAVAARGVKRITGRVVGDGAYFQGSPYGEGWEWDDLPYYYAPQISGLEAAEGVLAVHVAAGPVVGAPVRVTFDPPSRYLPLESTATTAAASAAGGQCAIIRPWQRDAVTVTGSVPLGQTASAAVTVEEPALYAATLLTEDLRRRGVVVDGAPAAAATPPLAAPVALASHTSVPMAQYIAKMNKPSDNLLAESLIRVVGAEKGGGGTYRAGHAVETAWLKSIGVDPAQMELVDGCGLAREDVVTPRAVAALLRAMHAEADWSAYYASLPIAGVDGSLRRRMIGTPAAGNVHAKTGSLHAVSSLSGYVTGRGGELYAFSLLMNDFPGSEADARGVQDRFAATLASRL